MCLSAVDYKAEGDLTSMGWVCTELGGEVFPLCGRGLCQTMAEQLPYPRLLLLTKFYNMRFISDNPTVTELSEPVE